MLCYRLSATNEEDRNEWIRCIQESIRDNPFTKIISDKKAALRRKSGQRFQPKVINESIKWTVTRQGKFQRVFRMKSASSIIMFSTRLWFKVCRWEYSRSTEVSLNSYNAPARYILMSKGLSLDVLNDINYNWSASHTYLVREETEETWYPATFTTSQTTKLSVGDSLEIEKILSRWPMFPRIMYTSLRCYHHRERLYTLHMTLQGCFLGL